LFRLTNSICNDSFSPFVYGGAIKDVVLFAYQNQIEIWAKDKYEEMLDQEPEEFGSIAESIFGGIKPLGNLQDPLS
jgi:hypothetical protein